MNLTQPDRGIVYTSSILGNNLPVSCGLAFEEQVVADLPVLDHDMPLSMLVTDRGIRRFASNCIETK